MTGRTARWTGVALLGLMVNIALSSWLLLDSLQGFLSSRGSGLAVLPRTMKVALFVLFLVASVRRPSGGRMALALATLFATSLLVLLTRGELDSRTVEIVVKLSMPLVAATAVLAVNESHEDVWCRRIVAINAAVLVANLILSWLGLGVPTYLTEDGVPIGGSGFFYAGNEVSAAILFCTAALMVFYRDSTLGLPASLSAMVFSATALLSRAALGGTALMCLLFVWRRSKVQFLALCLVVGGLGWRFWELVAATFQLAWNRWTFLAAEYGTSVSLLGGIKRLEEIRKYLSSLAYDPTLLVTGRGWSGAAENNLVDLVQAFGIFGFVLFVAWIALLFPTLPRLLLGRFLLRRDDAFFAIVSAILLVTLTIAGHVVQSTLIVPFAGVYLARNLERVREA